MDTTKWKSVAVRIEDYLVLKALCKRSYRPPAAMIGKLVDDYIDLKATKECVTSDVYKEKILKFKS